jgi:hypothetical protein
MFSGHLKFLSSKRRNLAIMVVGDAPTLESGEENEMDITGIGCHDRVRCQDGVEAADGLFAKPS